MEWEIGRNIRPGTPEFQQLVERVIWQESRNNPNAFNEGSGASGLMQVMPDTAVDPGFGVTPLDWDDRFDRSANRRFGEEYLAAMLNRYDGDVARALAAYNWGPGNADDWSGDTSSLPAETRGYIANITGGGAPSGIMSQWSEAPGGGGMASTTDNRVSAFTQQMNEAWARYSTQMSATTGIGPMPAARPATPRLHTARPLESSQLDNLFE
jgi:hypothetical protein